MASLGHLSKFERVSRLGFVAAVTSLNGGQPNFARCLAVSWASTLYIHFWGLLPPNGIFLGAKFTCVQVLRSPILAALLHDTRVVGVSQTLRRVQGMELRNLRSSSFSTEGATYTPTAAITLGIGRRSSFFELTVEVHEI